MRTPKPTVAVAAIGAILVAPAALFMAALLLRQVQPLLGMGRVVAWFAHHFVLGLGIFLVLMPLTAVLLGCAVMVGNWRRDSQFRAAATQLLRAARAQWPGLTIAATTLVAAGVLGLVGLHLINS